MLDLGRYRARHLDSELHSHAWTWKTLHVLAGELVLVVASMMRQPEHAGNGMTALSLLLK